MMLAAISIPVPSVKLTVVFLGALTLCATLTAMLLRYQRGVGFDAPDSHRKKHGGVISRLGGVPIFVTLLFGVSIMMMTVKGAEYEWWPVMLCNALVFGIGFLDDLKPLGARMKLLGQVGAACILYALGHSIDAVTHPTSHTHIPLGWWSPVVTVMWLISIPNIINLIDGMDGLATGFGLFLCLTLAFVGHFSAMPDVVMISTVMAGALAGFLLFNFPPAKIFLGDGGAYLIGFFIASVSLTTSQKGYILGALLVMVIALGVPILDTLFAIIRRGIRGVPLFRADAEHIHHRLISLGFSKGQALGIMYSVCVVLSLLGILVLTKRGLGIVIASASLVLLTLVAARALGYVRSYRGLRKQWNVAVQRRRDLAFARAYGRVLELEADRLATAEEFVTMLTHTLTRLGFTLAPESASAQGVARLGDNSHWRVGVPGQNTSEEQWRARLEELISAVDRAQERWGELPGLRIENKASDLSKPDEMMDTNLGVPAKMKP